MCRYKNKDISDCALTGSTGATWEWTAPQSVNSLAFFPFVVNADSLLAFLDLLHLTGLIHHFTVYHSLSHDFYNLPGPYIGVFCNKGRTAPGLITLFLFFSSKELVLKGLSLMCGDIKDVSGFELTFRWRRSFFDPVGQNNMITKNENTYKLKFILLCPFVFV